MCKAAALPTLTGLVFLFPLLLGSLFGSLQETEILWFHKSPDRDNICIECPV